MGSKLTALISALHVGKDQGSLATLLQIFKFLLVRSEKKLSVIIPQRKQHYRFIPEKQFLRPSWISPRRWKDLFAEAVNQEADMGWIEACRLVEEFSDWQPEEGEEDQVMVDYLWTLVCAQMTTAFRTALRLALFELPNACKDFMEMTNVLHQINQRSIKGASIRIQPAEDHAQRGLL